ncbi:4807_t:CDS:2 [Racocetra fulgida]|uniref:4807_t:CDS:1 n=1 Tax=Racocetra fulgida TaxID=60492 RepID=A0A9N9EZL7_9GLOM|nr:4807_t:CDS:2 [Racocetra fulgida]
MKRKTSFFIFPVSSSKFLHLSTIPSSNQKTIKITDLPLEIFIEICNHLTPMALFSMMCVCKQFHYWLNSTTSYITREIWRVSRLKFLEYLQLAPPRSMDEISYIKLAMLQKGCQFCSSKRETPKTPSWARNPIDVALVLPHEYIVPYGQIFKVRAYLASDVRAIHRECISVSLDNIIDWIRCKQQLATEIINDAEIREKVDEEILISKIKENRRIFDTTISTLLNTKNEYGHQKYLEKYILMLPSYKKAKDGLSKPFMTNPWSNLLDNMKCEYFKLMKLRRRRQIISTLLSLITSHDTLSSKISLSDPIVDCIHWCPSFINPPYVNDDPFIPWSKEFLVETLIQQLRKEARLLLRNKNFLRPGPFTSVHGAKNLFSCLYLDEKSYKCKLCWSDFTTSYTYKKIYIHLISCRWRRSIENIDEEKMIEVDRSVVHKYIPQWFKYFKTE